ncbi:MAG: FMN-binding protein [Clostridiaceae bacterium]|jgi:uncharacterized protein with FMN-binding domain|nr:FMN-binding protein [Clostridiaceae bacterium]
MPKLIKFIAIAIIVVFILIIAAFFYIKSMKLPEIEIKSVDLKKVSNGSYTGEYKSGPVLAIVRVNVENNRISAVKIEKHECGLGKKAEKITSEIERSQSLNVDVVSGATLSSKVILKAAETALEKGM